MFRVVFNMVIILVVFLLMGLVNQIFKGHGQNTLSSRNHPGHSHPGHTAKRIVSKINNYKLHGVIIKTNKKRNSNY